MKRNKMRFKFIIPIILAVIVIAGIIAIGLKSSNIYAAYTDTSNGNNVTYTLSKTTLKITGSGKVTDAWKNSSLNSELSNLQTSIKAVSIAKTITGIEASAFEGCTALTKVTFASGATCKSIGNKAFKGCTALTNIVNVTTSNRLPTTITTIGDEAFSGCSSLPKLNLNTGVTTIGTNAFYGTNSLINLTIHNIQNSNNAFKGNKVLTTLTIGSTCTTIQNNMFEGCTALTTVTFAKDSTCTTIGNSAFKGCTSLSNIKDNTTDNRLPKTITTIGNEAFSGCSSLPELNLNTGVTNVGENAFQGATSLATLTIYNIQNATNAFKGNKALTTLTVGKTCTTIQNNMFEGCTALTTVTFAEDSTCTTIGNSAFKGCTGLNKKVTLPESITIIGTSAFEGCTLLPNINIPNKVTTIDSSIFRGCSALNSLTVGTGVTSIGKDAFKDAKLEGTLTYNAINCTTYNNAFAGKQFGTVKVGSNVEVIPENFIKENERVQSISLSAKVKEIKTDAFNGCIIKKGLIIKNKDCKIETPSTISKNTTVFVKIEASNAYRSFAGLKSDGTTFSTLLNWLYNNDKAYVPYTSKPRDTKNMSEVSQSVDDRASKTNGFISTLGDYGYKVGTKGGPSGTKREWLFGNVYGGDRIFG